MRHTLRQLEVFLAVARAESVSGAARALSMSQSAASAALLDLERQFDVQLFDRRGRRLHLNEAGRGARARAESVLEHARELDRTLARGADAGPLRVGATLTIGNYVAPALLARFMREQPAAPAPGLVIANTAEISRRVATFDLDVGLIEGEVTHPDLEMTPWRDDQLVVFCAADHPLARKRTLDDADLAGASWIVRERGSGTRQAFDRAMRGLLPQLRIALTLEQTEAIKGAVAQGLGISCLSRIALELALEAGGLRACRVPHRDFRRQFYFLLHKRKLRGANLSRWLDLCRAFG